MDPTAGVRGQSSSGLAYRGESSYGEEESSHDPAASSGSVAFQQPPHSQVKQYENTAEFHQQKWRAAAPNQPYLNNKNTSSSSSAMSHHNNKQPADPQDAANAWVMYQDKSGHFYWHNHLTGESQWARESESSSATQYGGHEVESSHGVDFTRHASSSASSSAWPKGETAEPQEEAYVASDVSEDGSSSVVSGGAADASSLSSSVDWDSEDEDDFEELLRSVEGQQALRDEEQAVAAKLEEAQQRRTDGYWGWLLPYHGLSRQDFSDVSSDEEEGDSDDDEEGEGEEEGDDDAEDLQQPRSSSSPRQQQQRRPARLRTKTLTLGPPSSASFPIKAVRAIRGLVTVTTWVVSTGLATLYVFARELVASRPAGMSEEAAEEAVQRWKQVVVLESRRRDQALEDGRAGDGLAADGDDEAQGGHRGETPMAGGRRTFRKPPPLDLSVL